jgi:hypothetical protein
MGAPLQDSAVRRPRPHLVVNWRLIAALSANGGIWAGIVALVKAVF